MSQVGISKLHYAKITTDETTSANPVYGTVQAPTCGLVSVDISTSTNTTSLYADNILWDTETSQGEITANFTIADFPMDMQADLLGHTYDSSAKTLIKKVDDTAPYCAVGFEFLQASGKKLCVWLYKGKFSEPTTSGSTKGENTEFQTSEMTASFSALKGAGGNTGRWMYTQEFGATESTDSFYTTVPLASN